MANNLEEKTEPSHKIKRWELVVPVIGTGAYLTRCFIESQIPSVEYSNKVVGKTTFLIAKDIFLISGAIIGYALTK